MEQYSEILSNNVINIIEALDEGVYVTGKADTTLHINEIMFTTAGTLSGGSERSLKAIMADFEKTGNSGSR